MTLYDLIGLSGVAISTLCYAVLQWHRDFAKHFLYSFGNLASAILMFISLSQNWNMASFLSNFFLVILSLYGIYRCLKYKYARKALEVSPPEPSLTPDNKKAA